MKVTFFSNFLNHHQTPISDELYRILGDNYTFVSTIKTPERFLQGGYPNCETYSYNLLAWENKANHKKAMCLAMESDIVIIGAAPFFYTKARIKQNKPTFRYSERWYKKIGLKLFHPNVLLNVLMQHTLVRNKAVYMLCASAYLPNDLRFSFSYPKKCYKWGYFTKVPNHNIEEIIDSKQPGSLKILWVGRFLDWKKPELPILLAHLLKQDEYKFHITMIGAPDYTDKNSKAVYEKMQILIKDLGVSDYVTILGNMPNDKVLEKMRESNVFLFTSNRQEGWGAVLNEAMSNGCAVIASHTIGATPYLIEADVNGLVFESGNINSLYNKAKQLFDNPDLSKIIAKKAYTTMVEVWSPENAVKNLILLFDVILKNQNYTILEGPCSNAERIK